MMTFTRNRLVPLGLSIQRSTATLIQLAGSAERFVLRSAAECRLPLPIGKDAETDDRTQIDALKTFVADNHLQGRSVVSCLRADELTVETVRLPLLPPDEVKKVVLWEASERLSIPQDEAEVRHLVAGEIRQDNTVKQEVILIACPKNVIRRRLKVLEEAGLSPVGLDVEPCAWFRSLYRAQGRPENARMAYLFCSESGSTVLFAEGQKILFMKSILTGGHEFDVAISQTLGIELAAAHQMRSEVFAARTLNGENEIHRSIVEALRPCFETIIEEIELCRRYHKVTFRGRPLEGMVMAGSESASWLRDYFGERVGLNTNPASPLDCVAGTSPSQIVQHVPGRWATAMGLALKRLEENQPKLRRRFSWLSAKARS